MAGHLSLRTLAQLTAGAIVFKYLRRLLTEQVQHPIGNAANLPLRAGTGAQFYKVQELACVHGKQDIQLMTAESVIAQVFTGYTAGNRLRGRLCLSAVRSSIALLCFRDGAYRIGHDIISTGKRTPAHRESPEIESYAGQSA